MNKKRRQERLRIRRRKSAAAKNQRQGESPAASPVILPACKPMAGFCAQDAEPNSRVLVEICGFHTFDEGLPFYHMLEAFDPYLRLMNSNPWATKDLLLVLRPNETLAFLNDALPIRAKIRPKRSLEAGEGVFTDDIACIDALNFPGVIPEGAVGFLLLLSVGWRRGICFDCRPSHAESEVSAKDAFQYIQRVGAMVLAHLFFTERFLLSPEDWAKVLEVGWFPFVFLSGAFWNDIFRAITNGWDLERVEQKIHAAWLARCESQFSAWKTNECFKEHIPFLRRALDAYQKGDWVSVVALAGPRVEGLLRQSFGAWGKERELLEKVEGNLKEREHSRSLLFPDRLRQYFEQVFFRFVKFSEGDHSFSRHTLAHGLVSEQDISRKQALTLMLLIDHILYCMPADGDEAQNKGTVATT